MQYLSIICGSFMSRGLEHLYLLFFHSSFLIFYVNSYSANIYWMPITCVALLHMCLQLNFFMTLWNRHCCPQYGLSVFPRRPSLTWNKLDRKWSLREVRILPQSHKMCPGLHIQQMELLNTFFCSLHSYSEIKEWYIFFQLKWHWWILSLSFLQ